MLATYSQHYSFVHGLVLAMKDDQRAQCISDSRRNMLKLEGQIVRNQTTREAQLQYVSKYRHRTSTPASVLTYSDKCIFNFKLANGPGTQRRAYPHGSVL